MKFGGLFFLAGAAKISEMAKSFSVVLMSIVLPQTFLVT